MGLCSLDCWAFCCILYFFLALLFLVRARNPRIRFVHTHKAFTHSMHHHITCLRLFESTPMHLFRANREERSHAHTFWMHTCPHFVCMLSFLWTQTVLGILCAQDSYLAVVAPNIRKTSAKPIFLALGVSGVRTALSVCILTQDVCVCAHTLHHSDL